TGNVVSGKSALDAGDHRRAGGGRRARALHSAAIRGAGDVPPRRGLRVDRAAAGRNGACARRAASGVTPLPEVRTDSSIRRPTSIGFGGGGSGRAAFLPAGG